MQILLSALASYGELFVTESQSTFWFYIPGQEECAKSGLS